MSNDTKNPMNNYCPRCGSKYSSQLLALFRIDTESITCEFCNLCIYNGPKLAVGAVIISGDSYLMSERGIEPDKGCYDFPGGFAGIGETVEQAIERELYEELRLTKNSYQIISIIGSINHQYQNKGRPDEEYNVTTIMFRISTTQKEFKVNDDVAQYIWTPIGELPEKELSKMSILEFIQDHDYFRAYKNELESI